MKVLQTIVAGTGFRDAEHNAARMSAMDHVLGVANQSSADLLVLPGGYLTAKDENELADLIALAGRRSAAANVTLAFGVDLSLSEKGKGQTGKGARNAYLPYFGSICGRSTGGPWRQTSDNSTNCDDVADEDVPGASRVVEVAGKRVGVLVCGELFSKWARRSFADLELDLVVDLGHIGMGQGLIPAMKSLANYGGCSVVHSQHVKPTSNAGLHFVSADGEAQSVPVSDSDYFGDDEFWIAWRMREL